MKEDKSQDTPLNKDRVVHNAPNKLLKEIKGGMIVGTYHVESFAGLLPVWPIVEMAMTPTSASKDDRMAQFI